jgi:hypothetical protein
MRFIASVVILSIALTGCVTVNKRAIDDKAAAQIKSQTVTYTTRKKPDFSATTAGKAGFGLFGAAAMISAGKRIIESNNVADPADTIALGLAKALEGAHGTQLVTPPTSVATDDAAKIAASSNSRSKYIIDAQTINWSFVYFPTDWSHYRVIYSAKARLIDAQTKAVLAEGACKRVPESNTAAPTYDELLANEATRLKSELAAAADECVKTLKAEMLALR